MKNKISKSKEKSLNISIKKCIYKRKSTFHVSKIWHEKYNHYNKNLNGWVKWQIVLCCAKSLHLYLTLHDRMDCSPPGSSIHGILQVKYWSGLPCLPPGDLPNPGMVEFTSLAAPSLADGFFTTSATWEAQMAD